jgi:dihydrofolate reductase
MSRLKVQAFAVSIDGFGAGPGQSMAHPLGVRGESLHQWFFPTRTFKEMHGIAGGEEGEGGEADRGSTGVDDDFARRSFDNIGAWIMGRNMFGPSRGPWPDDGWKGWWGPNPPYHVPIFVLTHHPRPPITMDGGTVFRFVGGIQEAVAQAREAAQGRDVRVGGGVATVRQYLQAGLLDEMHLVISPTLLGSGEALLAGFDLLRLGFRVTEHVASPHASHVVLTKG